MLAATRERRGNAGAKMATLLNQEDCDDFYKSTYGGFFEEQNDNAYVSPVDSDEDSFDSDFDVSTEEDDQVISDDEQAKPKRHKRMAVGVYKEPVRRPTGEPSKPRVRKSAGGDDTKLLVERRFRSTTVQKSEKFGKKMKDKMERRKGKSYSKPKELKMTQDQRLKEAVKTEDFNLKSLARWEEFEAEQKAKRERMLKKRGAVTGSRVKTISLTKSYSKSSEGGCEVKTERESRQFLVFSDDIAAKPYMEMGKTSKSHPRVKRLLCPVTGLTAKYFDPVTKTPYANARAFKVIRNAYTDYVKERGDIQDEMISKWLSYVQT